MPGTELFVGIVAPTAVEYMPAVEAMEDRLEKLGFTINRIKLSELIGILKPSVTDSADSIGEDERIRSLMDRGDDVRRNLKDGSALAKIAMLKIAAYRRDKFDSEMIPDGHNIAHIFLSLKNVREMAFLRATYGDAF